MPLLAPRARVRLLSCSFESFTRRSRRWSSARRGAVSVFCAPPSRPRCPAAAAGEPGWASWCWTAILPHALSARSDTAARCPSAVIETWAEHHQATCAQCDMLNYEYEAAGRKSDQSGRTRGPVGRRPASAIRCNSPVTSGPVTLGPGSMRREPKEQPGLLPLGCKVAACPLNMCVRHHVHSSTQPAASTVATEPRVPSLAACSSLCLCAIAV